MKKISIAAALALALAAVPAAAKDHPGQGHGNAAKPEQAAHPGKSHKCTAHGRGYVAGGKLVSATLTKNDDGTYSGQLTITVVRANHHAKPAKGTDQTYTLDHARVNLHGQDPAALKPGSPAFVLGKVTFLAKKCDQTGFTATTTIRKADIKAPKAAKTDSTDAQKPAETEAPETSS
jgi:hypothetical protein